jgi:hypothetical protein
MKVSTKKITRALAATAAAAIIGAGVAPSMASASSTVNVGGYATCSSPIGSLAARSVSIALDSGGYSSVGTSSLPWSNGLYRMTFGYMPSGGTWATAYVNCSSFAWHPGSHSFRIWLKPDWRNTTGDHSFWNV